MRRSIHRSAELFFNSAAPMLAWLATIALFLAAVPRAAAASHYHVVHGWPELPEGFAFGDVYVCDIKGMRAQKFARR